jgi:hypothetical protein
MQAPVVLPALTHLKACLTHAAVIAPCLHLRMPLQLMPESLFLTINLIDRYLAVRQVTRKNLQLVSGTAALCAGMLLELANLWISSLREAFSCAAMPARKDVAAFQPAWLSTLPHRPHPALTCGPPPNGSPCVVLSPLHPLLPAGGCHGHAGGGQV